MSFYRDQLDVIIKETVEFDPKKYVENFLSRVQSSDKLPMSILVNQGDDSLLTTSTTDSSLESQPMPPKFYSPLNRPEKPRRFHQHWTEIVSVEQLFGLPPSDKIDKNIGNPDDEEWEEILKDRQKYQETFGVFNQKKIKND